MKLAELQRDLGGYESLLKEDREFLREGCLQKLSRKGYQQRMFFLVRKNKTDTVPYAEHKPGFRQNNFFFFLLFQFSDMLLYANRTTQPTLHFKVHGQMALTDLTVLDSEPRLGAEHCFNLYDGKKAVLLSAPSYNEKICWMDDIAEAAQVNYPELYCASVLHFFPGRVQFYVRYPIADGKGTNL